ncbi:hypothetical protein [Sphingomonas soli]|uniref:hypothetical protein n=1 Tax=Sphingomonas soli TaxID=266127 RepID=UPI00082967BD|nr:hypothetical protein [Sphingomonas soli]
MQTNRYLRATLLACASLLASTAAAQDKEPAPKIDSTSPGGVSYGTGAFTYEVPVLSIGSGGFPQALQLSHQYRSDGARDPSTAWTTNLDTRISATRTDTVMESTCPPYCNPGDYTWSWNLVIGHRSASFYKVGAGAGPGPYTPTQLDGSSLTYIPSGAYAGKHLYTSSDGAEMVLDLPTGGGTSGPPLSWTEADGTTIAYGASSISTNRGVAIFRENGTGKTCAINLTQYYLPALSACPSGVPTSTQGGSGNITTITNSSGGTYTFTYGTDTYDGDDGHLLCVTEPDQSGCTISNTYDDCDGYGYLADGDLNWNGSRDRVTAQSFATGETIAYSYLESEYSPGVPRTACRMNLQTTMTRDGQNVVVGLSNVGGPTSIQNELGKTSTLSYTGPSVTYADFTRPLKYTAPEGNSVEYTYDARGNITETRRKKKTGASEADIVTSATYPSSCSASGISAKNCNKPATVTDANGNVTSYTYSDVHGGVLTETGPAVQVNGTGSAISPVKRYAYAQRYAWIKNSGGTFSQAATPVWVLTEERSCRTTATVSNACSGGANDEVIVSYDYGPDTGLVGNNLWLRGKTVTAYDTTLTSVTSLRTCYGYDAQGNKIWETTPRAGLSACY